MPQSPPDGHLALPATNAAIPVLVLHAWWGLNQTTRDICAKLTEHGHTAFAPDLYHGQTAETITQAETLSNALETTKVQAELAHAIRFVQQYAPPNNPAIAVIGFSLGAYFALELSCTSPEDICKVVVFYGTGPRDFAQSQASYLGHFAENDPFEPQAEVNTLQAALQNSHRPATFYTYPNTGHWFFEPDRTDAYHPEAATLAWERTLDFLKDTP